MQVKSKVIITGANGFVGSAAFNKISELEQYTVSGAVRHNTEKSSFISIGDMNYETDWSNILRGQNVVIHTAARAHVMIDEAINPLAEYRRVNVEASVNLAKQAARAGVNRFIFISSIKVNGNGGERSRVYYHNDPPAPEDNYGISKAEAEVELKKIAEDTGMEMVIIRPTLIYGPDVKGNFNSLIKLVCWGLPLPLGAIHNCRSMVAIDNLIDLIVTCIDHPKASGQTFLVSDDQDMSTTELLEVMAHSFNKKAILIPIPAKLLHIAARLLGREAIVDRLCGSLKVDITHTKETLDWRPPVTMEQQLAKIVESMHLSSRSI
ncbi:UDP-glucose 4-epimerase family protein [Aeromonas caviae]|uniref:SDR family oxidoreductase n=1 Tax=Aeromonas caviae TaxID=648 RepID=A0AAF0GEP8_AERCA|nr:SDR family oxidoreductase [Aeromonas caviae]WGC85820.1 SDR family oxidoreductase [Aeromonas caviae]BBG90120.1 UDP-glucose 4-epimerase [Aeromonas caviae]BBT53776.1 UDP-glucose 4-epimerase [Aeromonas caviae]